MPNATKPAANGKLVVPARAAELVQVAPLKSAPAPVATNLTTTELGFTPVRVLLIKSEFTDSDARALGVSKQEQHEINCSSGEKV